MFPPCVYLSSRHVLAWSGQSRFILCTFARSHELAEYPGDVGLVCHQLAGDDLVAELLDLVSCVVASCELLAELLAELPPPPPPPPAPPPLLSGNSASGSAGSNTPRRIWTP